MSIRLAVVVVVALSAAALAQTLEPFVLPWDDASAGPTNLQETLHTPAGRLGFIRATDAGHFAAGDERIRFWGVNVTSAGAFPTKEQAPKIAARLAKFGFNAVRFHHIEPTWAEPGVIDYAAGGSTTLNAEGLDRIHFFVAELARRGLYTNMNLLVSRSFKAADGFDKAIEAMGWKDQHALGWFNDRHLALQKQYARQILATRNPYTGRSLAADPAVAIVEICNEHGFLQAWFSGTLDELPPPFAAQLRAKWNAWLRARHGSDAALHKAWGLREDPLGAEMIPEGGFAGGADGWIVEQHQGAEAVGRVEKGSGPGKAHAFRVDIRKIGGADWHVQVTRSGLAVEKGKLYTLSYAARAEAARPMAAAAQQAHEPWGPLGLHASAKLTPQWQTFRHSFVATASDANARINFTGLGTKGGAVWLANVSLRPGGRTGLEAGETLAAASVPVVSARGGRAWPAAARLDWVRFARETDAAYWIEMRRFLREDLGYRGVVVGTINANSPPLVQAQMDATDSHAYWQHPHFPGRPWDGANWIVHNRSIVNNPTAGPIWMAMQRVLGKPHLVTEYNHAAPNTFSGEAPLVLAAYAALQDWDGLFLFDYSNGRDYDGGRIGGFFGIGQHPTKMANSFVAALLFRGGLIRPAERVLAAPMTDPSELEILATKGTSWNVANATHAGLQAWQALLHRTGIGIGSRALSAAPAQPDGLYRSDTGQLAWDVRREGKGVITLDAPGARGVIGFVDGRSFDLGGVTIAPGRTLQDWCTIFLVRPDGRELAAAGSAVLVATGSAENTQMGWKNPQKNTVGADWGAAPTRVEVIPAVVTLPVAPAKVKAWALDAKGQRAAALKVAERDGKAVLTIGPPHKTLWYEIEIR